MIIAIIRMTIIEGRITPTVEHIAPKTPPTELPTKVEMLIAKGPGVHSLTAMKSVKLDSVIHPLETTCS